MRFEWNHDKDRMNQAKHKVSFDTACLVFDDPYHISIQDRFDNDEERWQTLGMVGGGATLLLVAHIVIEKKHEDTIRIISARKATKRERRFYEQTHQKTKS